MSNKTIKTFVIEVHGYNKEDVETGLEEAINRIYDADYEGSYSEIDELENRNIRGFKCEIINGKIDFIEGVDFVLNNS